MQAQVITGKFRIGKLLTFCCIYTKVFRICFASYFNCVFTSKDLFCSIIWTKNWGKDVFQSSVSVKTTGTSDFTSSMVSFSTWMFHQKNPETIVLYPCEKGNSCSEYSSVRHFRHVNHLCTSRGYVNYWEQHLED